MTVVDVRVDDLLDIFNFQQNVLPLKPLAAPMTTAQVMAQPPSLYSPDDDTGNENYREYTFPVRREERAHRGLARRRHS